MNRLCKFPDNQPPAKIFIYWDEEDQSWQIWFPENQDSPTPPRFTDGEFGSFTAKTFLYEMKS